MCRVGNIFLSGSSIENVCVLPDNEEVNFFMDTFPKTGIEIGRWAQIVRIKKNSWVLIIKRVSKEIETHTAYENQKKLSIRYYYRCFNPKDKKLYWIPEVYLI